MRNNIHFLVTLLLIGEFTTTTDAAGAPHFTLPFFLRGGSASASAVATRTRTKKQKTQRQHHRKPPNFKPIQLAAKNISQGLGKVGGKIQHDASNIGKNINREWGKLHSNTRKLVANIPRIKLRRRRRTLKSSKLDEVCHNFASVLRNNGNELDTAQLLKACRTHLAFMKSGGSSLRLVAKDLEANVQKAERVFKKQSPKESKCLSSMLECEKESGIHNGNELQEKSAAMGLLWIRRSLAFQLDLYSALIHANDVHPRDAAYDAYSKHLSPFHGWALRKVFPASLSQMPDRSVFIAKFGGIKVEELNDEYDKMIAKKLKSLVNTWDPLISSWKEEFERLGLEDTRRV